jgi:hypothetical protein
MEFQALDGRRVVADFDGGEITTDGLALGYGDGIYAVRGRGAICELRFTNYEDSYLRSCWARAALRDATVMTTF